MTEGRPSPGGVFGLREMGSIARNDGRFQTCAYVNEFVTFPDDSVACDRVEMWCLFDDFHARQRLLLDWLKGPFDALEHLFVPELPEDLKHGFLGVHIGRGKARSQ